MGLQVGKFLGEKITLWCHKRLDEEIRVAYSREKRANKNYLFNFSDNVEVKQIENEGASMEENYFTGKFYRNPFK